LLLKTNSVYILPELLYAVVTSIKPSMQFTLPPIMELYTFYMHTLYASVT